MNSHCSGHDPASALISSSIPIPKDVKDIIIMISLEG